MKNLAKAILNVMRAVKGIDKTMTVGKGDNAYKGVSDQEVKKVLGEAMEQNGLCIMPIGIKPTVRIDRWEEPGWNGGASKPKQSVFTEVVTEYLLLHESGESQLLFGYGQGVDSQDKAAGKATTYALKYLLLYTFMVPTGKIDDADNTHSDEISIPEKTLAEKVYEAKAVLSEAVKENFGSYWKTLSNEMQANAEVIQFAKESKEKLGIKTKKDAAA